MSRIIMVTVPTSLATGELGTVLIQFDKAAFWRKTGLALRGCVSAAARADVILPMLGQSSLVRVELGALRSGGVDRTEVASGSATFTMLGSRQMTIAVIGVVAYQPAPGQEFVEVTLEDVIPDERPVSVTVANADPNLPDRISISHPATGKPGDKIAITVTIFYPELAGGTAGILPVVTSPYPPRILFEPDTTQGGSTSYPLPVVIGPDGLASASFAFTMPEVDCRLSVFTSRIGVLGGMYSIWVRMDEASAVVRLEAMPRITQFTIADYVRG